MTKPHREGSGARRAVVWFVVVDLCAMVLIGVAGLALARRVAVNQAKDGAITVVRTDARHVGPLLVPGAVSGDPAATAALDAVVRTRVLDDDVVRVKVWDAQGRIVWSDDPALIGEVYPLDDEEQVALETRSTKADVSDLTKPENRDEVVYGKLLEVYSGVRTTDGQPLLFEAYLRFDGVDSEVNQIVRDYAPALIWGVGAFFLLQIPLAVGLARRVRRAEEERSEMLEKVLATGEQERARIAADLHDSVVQQLAGTSLSLAAVAAQLEQKGDTETAQVVSERAAALRQDVRDLRTLIVSMVPPRLHDEGLSAALGDLLSPLPAQGVQATVSVAPDLDLGPTAEALLFRAAQEAVRNITAHAGATRVTVAVGPAGEGRARLRVVDDGVGMDDATRSAARAGGHFGLSLLTELVEQAGGACTIESAPGEGTALTVEVPDR